MKNKLPKLQQVPVADLGLICAYRFPSHCGGQRHYCEEPAVVICFVPGTRIRGYRCDKHRDRISPTQTGEWIETERLRLSKPYQQILAERPS